MKYIALIVLILLCSNIKLASQNSNTDEHIDSLDDKLLARPYILLGGDYVSRVSYNGRTEGIKQYGISPTLAWHIGKGFLLTYEGNFWSATIPRYAFTSVGIKKSFNWDDFSAEFGYSRWFLNKATTAASSSFTQLFEATGNYTLGDFTLELYLSSIGRKKNNFITPTLSWEKSGRFGKYRQFKWFAGPDISVDFGNGTLSKIITKNSIVTTSNIKQPFGLLNYALEATMGIKNKNTTATIIYSYNTPKNTTAAPNVNSPLSYWEIEVKRVFGW